MGFDEKKLYAIIHSKEPLRALDYFSELERAGDLDVGARGHRAYFLRGMGKYDESLRDYEAMLAERPEDDEARTWFADVLIRTGQLDRGVSEVLGVLNRNPKSTNALKVLKYYQDSVFVAAPEPKSNTVSPIQSPARNQVLDALEKDPGAYPSISFPEVGRTIYELVRLIRPNLAIEVGSYVGYTTTLIAQAMKDNGRGHLHAFDLFGPLDDYTSPVVGRCEDCYQAVSHHVHRAGLDDMVTLHKGDSSSMIRMDMNTFKEKVDFAFIDGDHRLQGCMKDWLSVDELLATGGLVLLHDTFPKGCGWFGPKYLLDKLDKSQRDKYSAINLPSPEGFGLALIQKNTSGICDLNLPTLTEWFRERLYYKSHPFGG